MTVLIVANEEIHPHISSSSKEQLAVEHSYQYSDKDVVQQAFKTANRIMNRRGELSNSEPEPHDLAPAADHNTRYTRYPYVITGTGRVNKYRRAGNRGAGYNGFIRTRLGVGR